MPKIEVTNVKGKKKNEQTRQEIIILREQLMAGSTIKESRRSIERGDNMKMLTSISVIFLLLDVD